jgi:predicted nucleic acid-binding protein
VILVDTSAWIEFDRATSSAVDRRLTGLISGGGAIAVTEPIIAEVLAGARTNERGLSLRRLLGRCDLLGFDSVLDFDGAVAVYRTCRQAGVTPRGLLDCMIVAVAIRHDVPLLAWDADMVRIADVTELRLDPATVAWPP